MYTYPVQIPASKVRTMFPVKRLCSKTVAEAFLCLGKNMQIPIIMILKWMAGLKRLCELQTISFCGSEWTDARNKEKAVGVRGLACHLA